MSAKRQARSSAQAVSKETPQREGFDVLSDFDFAAGLDMLGNAALEADGIERNNNYCSQGKSGPGLRH